MTTKLIFDVGDIVDVKSYSHGYEGKGQIVALRHVVGNLRTGSLSAGCDLLLGDGRVCFVYLHDLVKTNMARLTALAS